MDITKKVVLHFPPTIVEKPIIYLLIKEFNLIFNILKADIIPRQQGLMVLELSGNEQSYEKGINYLKELGVTVQTLDQDITWSDEICTQCGVCTTICPTGALYMTRPSMMVSFDYEKCIACEVCVTACPPRAITVSF